MRREEDLELWGRDMDQDDWMRGTYGSGNMPSRFGRRAWGSEWNRGPDFNRGSDWRQGPNFNRGSNWTAGFDQTPGWQRHEQYSGPEPWRGDRDWSQEWWHHNAGFGWTGNPWEARGRQWHGRTTARGYQRSDERIREDVYERLMEHPYIDTTDIEVSVSKGEVTLEGTVPDRWEKRLAEDLTEGVFGVSEVHNRLRTSAGSTSQPERGGTVSHTPVTGASGLTDGAEAPRPTHESPRPMSASTGSSGWPSS